MRYHGTPDHPSGLFFWETGIYSVADNQFVTHLVAGAPAEPGGIQRFKVYALFFERDGSNVADIDIRVYDSNCGAGRTLLGSDLSRDTKSQVTVGTQAAGKNLCVELEGYHVPPGQTRDVVLVVYYSDLTAMR